MNEKKKHSEKNVVLSLIRELDACWDNISWKSIHKELTLHTYIPINPNRLAWGAGIKDIEFGLYGWRWGSRYSTVSSIVMMMMLAVFRWDWIKKVHWEKHYTCTNKLYEKEMFHKEVQVWVWKLFDHCVLKPHGTGRVTSPTALSHWGLSSRFSGYTSLHIPFLWKKIKSELKNLLSFHSCAWPKTFRSIDLEKYHCPAEPDKSGIDTTILLTLMVQYL